ncbi:MAG: LysR family transcriptional regulator [Paracoccaceae bacterium]
MRALPETVLLHSFVTVAEELNFRRGAARLGLDQSALSRRIRKLEEHVGAPLFERTTREVSLTPAGRSLYRAAAAILAETGRALDEARRIAEGRAGRVRVGYMAFAATDLLPRAVALFRARHPDVALDLRYIRTQGQKVALANDEIDAGLLIGPFENADYHALMLRSERLFAVARPGDPLFEGGPVTPARLMARPLVLGDVRNWGEYRFWLDDLFTPLGLAPRPALEASNTLAISGLVARGLGVTIYPESLASALPPGLEARPIEAPGFVSRTVLVWKRTNRARTLLNFVAAAREGAEG